LIKKEIDKEFKLSNLYQNLWLFLPSNHKRLLSLTIGKKLIEIERFLFDKPERFVIFPEQKKADFFSRNPGAVQFWFEGNVRHSLTIDDSQFSILLTPHFFKASEFDKLYRLSKIDRQFVEKGFKDCLGKICQDIKIWTYFEDYAQGEAAQAGISYVFSNGSELLYSIYLHGDLTEDFLLIDFPIPPEIVADCYSIAKQCSIKYQ
jgi:hypothetical protein